MAEEGDVREFYLTSHGETPIKKPLITIGKKMANIGGIEEGKTVTIFYKLRGDVPQSVVVRQDSASKGGDYINVKEYYNYLELNSGGMFEAIFIIN